MSIAPTPGRGSTRREPEWLPFVQLPERALDDFAAKRLTAVDCVVLSAVLRFMRNRKELECSPTNEEIGRSIGRSKETVNKSLAKLEREAYLDRVIDWSVVAGRRIVLRFRTWYATSGKPGPAESKIALAELPEEPAQEPAPTLSKSEDPPPQNRRATSQRAPAESTATPSGTEVGGPRFCGGPSSYVRNDVQTGEKKALTRQAPQGGEPTPEEIEGWRRSDDPVLRRIAGMADAAEEKPRPRPRPAPPPPPPQPRPAAHLPPPDGRRPKTTELLAALEAPCGPEAIALAARALAEDFRDFHSERKFLKECRALAGGRRSLGEVMDAYQAAMDRGSRNKGAVFVTVLEAQKLTPGPTFHSAPGVSRIRSSVPVAKCTQEVIP